MKEGLDAKREEAKKLTIHVVHFKSQIRGETLAEVRIMRKACMQYISRNHKSCITWFICKKADNTGNRTRYNKVLT